MTEEQGNELKYSAFISYCSADQAVAEWLHRSLESQRIPAASRRLGSQSWPRGRTLAPVFRDREELHVAPDLSAAVYAALRSSRFLVVVCSPSASRSEWVNREIRFFRSLGRGDRILTVITNGEAVAHGPSPQGAFPPALFEDDGGAGRSVAEPLGADLRPGGDTKRYAIYKLAAPIIGVPVADLAQREGRRRHRRSLLLGLLLLGLLVAGAGYWDYQRPKVTRFANFGWRWAMPEGVGPLTAQQAKSREVYWEFTTRRGLLERVERMGDRGRLPDERSKDVFSIAYLYAEDRRPLSAEFRNATADLLQRIEFGPLQTLPSGGYQLRERFQDGSGLSVAQISESNPGDLFNVRDNEWDEGGPPPRMAVTQRLSILSDEGLTIEERMENAFGRPKANLFGVAATRYRYGQGCLPIETALIGADGQFASEGLGVCRTEFDYSVLGDPRTVRFYGIDGSLVRGPSGAFIKEYEFDEFGNVTQMSLRDGEGNSMLGADWWAILRYKRGSHGIVEGFHYLDRDNHPARCRSGFAAVQERRNDRGLLAEVTILGTDGAPSDVSVVTSIRLKYDESGRNVESTCFGPDGEATTGLGGYHMERKSYDGSGKVRRNEYFDERGAPTLADSGYASIVIDYDDSGVVVGSTVYDKDGQLASSRVHRGGVVRWDRDERGSVTAIRNFGPDGNPLLVTAGYHALVRQVDDCGRIASVAFLGINGEGVEDASGMAVEEHIFDASGNQQELRRLDAILKPTCSLDGWASCRYTYDALRRIVRIEYFGADGKPLGDDVGPAVRTRSYGLGGRLEEERYFRADGTVTVDGAGAFSVRTTWDDRGLQTAMATYNASGAPTLGTDGIFRTEWKYDDAGNMKEATYFGSDGEPVCDSSGIHRRVIEYDHFGRKARERYFGIDDQPVFAGAAGSGSQYVYDKLGRQVSTTCLGRDHLPSRGLDGVCRVDLVYDTASRVISEHYFDERGLPAYTYEGFAGKTREFDDYGRAVRVSFIDQTDREVASSNGYCQIEYRFDRIGRITEEILLGPAGNPAQDSNGVHRVAYEFDRFGGLAVEFRFGIGGSLVNGSGGYACRQCKYDVRGRCVMEALVGSDSVALRGPGNVAGKAWFYDPRGFIATELQFVASPDGVRLPTPAMVVRYQRDAGGRVLQQWNESADRKPMLDSAGIYRAQTTYDHRGLAIRMACFDAANAPLVGTVPHATSLIRDFEGRLVSASFFGPAGEAVPNADGCFSLLELLDERGNLVVRRCEDSSGAPSDRCGVRHGVCEDRWIYSPRNLKVEEASYGATGEYACDPSGSLARTTWRYDDLNRRVRISVFGVDGMPIPFFALPWSGVKVVHRYELEYDESGRLAQMRYFAVDGTEFVHP
jgi:hypothetical protein